MNTLYQLVDGLGGSVATFGVLVWLLATQRHLHQHREHAQVAKVKRELVRDLEPPKRTVDWQHVADLERDIYRKAYHHEGVPCCCAKCKRKRAPKRYPVKPVPVIELAPKVPQQTPRGVLAQLRAERQDVWERARALAEMAGPHHQFTSGEHGLFDAYMHRIDVLDQRIRAVDDITNRVYKAAREGLPKTRYGLGLNYIEVTAIGDREPTFLAADPQTQWQIDYDKGRDAGLDIIRRIENDNPPPALSD